MTQAFALMDKAEADRFMNGKDDHPIRDVTAGLIGNEKVLDIGCGRGIRVSELYDKYQYIGSDVSRTLIDRAREDNPVHVFVCVEGMDLLGTIPDNGRDNILISSVFEHMESLEDAQALFFEAVRASKRLIIGWNHPPHYDETEIIKVRAELKLPMNQNHYKEGSFDRDDLQIERIGVESCEVWTVRSR